MEDGHWFVQTLRGADRAVEALEFAGFPEGSSMVSSTRWSGNAWSESSRATGRNDVTGAAAVGPWVGMVVGGLPAFLSA